MKSWLVQRKILLRGEGDIVQCLGVIGELTDAEWAVVAGVLERAADGPFVLLTKDFLARLAVKLKAKLDDEVRRHGGSPIVVVWDMIHPLLEPTPDTKDGAEPRSLPPFALRRRQAEIADAKALLQQAGYTVTKDN